MSESSGEIPNQIEGQARPGNVTSSTSNLREVFGTLRRGYRELEGNLVEARRVPLPEEVQEAYNRHKGFISELYGADHVNPNLLYHGTGALQYAGDKYKGGVSREYRRPLDAILTEGLKPHHDMWVQAKNGGVESTSFATTWPYAKWYADKHQDPSDPLLWNFGDSTEWFQFYMLDTMKRAARDAALHPVRTIRKYAPNVPSQIAKIISQTRRGSSQESAQLNKLLKWISDVRSDITPDTLGIDVLRGATDIPGNFGAIITIDKDDVELFDMGPGGVYEARTDSAVVPGRFKSLAVPLDKVEEYQAKTQVLGLAIPVLPTEAVDYHFSRFPFKELTTGLRAK